MDPIPIGLKENMIKDKKKTFEWQKNIDINQNEEYKNFRKISEKFQKNFRKISRIKFNIKNYFENWDK